MSAIDRKRAAKVAAREAAAAARFAAAAKVVAGYKLAAPLTERILALGIDTIEMFLDSMRAFHVANGDDERAWNIYRAIANGAGGRAWNIYAVRE